MSYRHSFLVITKMGSITDLFAFENGLVLSEFDVWCDT